MSNKRASLGFGWVKLLVILTGMGLVYIIMNQALTVHFIPALNTTANVTLNGSNADMFSNQSVRALNYFNMFPYILVLIFGIYTVIAALRSSARGSV